jgi:hypothetical protein
MIADPKLYKFLIDVYVSSKRGKFSIGIRSFGMSWGTFLYKTLGLLVLKIL